MTETEPVCVYANVQNKSVNNDIRNICASMGVCANVCMSVNVEQQSMYDAIHGCLSNSKSSSSS